MACIDGIHIHLLYIPSFRRAAGGKEEEFRRSEQIWKGREGKGCWTANRRIEYEALSAMEEGMNGPNQKRPRNGSFRNPEARERLDILSLFFCFNSRKSPRSNWLILVLYAGCKKTYPCHMCLVTRWDTYMHLLYIQMGLWSMCLCLLERSRRSIYYYFECICNCSFTHRSFSLDQVQT